jgi:hypothetical protein
MANSVHYGCTSLNGTNKAGLIQPDGNGYRKMVVGALNMFNSAGEYYEYERAKSLFDNSSQFMRRVGRGVLKGEYGHPKMIPGQSIQQFATRVLTIDEQNVCAHFREIWLDFDSVKDKDGKAVVAIMAWVKPSGPMGQYLAQSLENSDENVCFSIRAFTDDKMEGRVKKRILKTIVTFDHVLEPGMAVQVAGARIVYRSGHSTRSTGRCFCSQGRSVRDGVGQRFSSRTLPCLWLASTARCDACLGEVVSKCPGGNPWVLCPNEEFLKHILPM